MDKAIKKEQVRCPYCGYRMPVFFSPALAKCRGVFFKCKNKACKKEFELKL